MEYPSPQEAVDGERLQESEFRLRDLARRPARGYSVGTVLHVTALVVILQSIALEGIPWTTPVKQAGVVVFLLGVVLLIVELVDNLLCTLDESHDCLECRLDMDRWTAEWNRFTPYWVVSLGNAGILCIVAGGVLVIVGTPPPLAPGGGL